MEPVHQMSFSLLPASVLEGLVIGMLCLALLLAFVWHAAINSKSRWEHKLSEYTLLKPEGWLSSAEPSALYSHLQKGTETFMAALPNVLCGVAFLLGVVQLYGALALLQPDTPYMQLLLHLTQQAKIFIWVLVAVAFICALNKVLNTEVKVKAWLSEQIADKKRSNPAGTVAQTNEVVELLQKLIDLGREQEVVNVQSLAKIEGILEKYTQPSAISAETFQPLQTQLEKSTGNQQAILEVLQRIEKQSVSSEQNGKDASAANSLGSNHQMAPVLQRMDVIQSKLQEHVTGQQSVLLSVLQTIKDGQNSTATNSEKLHQEFRVLIAAIEKKFAQTPVAEPMASEGAPNHTLPVPAGRTANHPLVQSKPQTPVIKAEPSIYSYNSSQTFANDAVWPTYPSEPAEHSSPLPNTMPVIESSTGYESDPVVYNASEPVEHVAVPSMSHPIQKQVMSGTMTSHNPQVFALLNEWKDRYDSHMEKILEYGQINSAATKTISQIVFQQEQYLAKVFQHVSVLLDYSKISSKDQQKMVQLLENIAAATPMEGSMETGRTESSVDPQVMQLLEMQQRTLVEHQQNTHRDLQQLIALLEQSQTKEIDDHYAQQDSVLPELIERLPEQLETIWQNHQMQEQVFLKDLFEQFAAQQSSSVPAAAMSSDAPSVVTAVLPESVEQNIADLRSNVEQTSTYMVETLERIEGVVSRGS